MDALRPRRRRLGRRRRHAGAGAGGQALGAALGQRLRDAAPDAARRRGAEPARALPGGAGLRRGGRRGGARQRGRHDERAGLSRLERDGAAPPRGAGGDGGGAGRGRATRRRCTPRAGRRGRSSSGRGRRWRRRPAVRRGRRGLHLRARPRRRRWRWPGAGSPARRSSTTASRPGSSRRCRSTRTAGWRWRIRRASVLQAANSETGVMQDAAARGWPASTRCRRSGGCPSPSTGAARGRRSSRRTSSADRRASGRCCWRRARSWRRCCAAAGRRCGRRAGTENVVGIAGFGAAIEAAAAELAARRLGGGGRGAEYSRGGSGIRGAASLSLSGRARRGCRTPAASPCPAGRARPR